MKVLVYDEEKQINLDGSRTTLQGSPEGEGTPEAVCNSCYDEGEYKDGMLSEVN